ncbi:Maf family protein [Pseudooceanicola sp.]|uniref:Maf family protein n=1 Tax=Pseudooceanicola sp. TaxID=1914328 RepID=UPI002615718D|nr:Maf family protein [Pseudooceanicola sp.]MDF1854950.1 Maf family protein [Pseudooceanicola sp.]
MAQTVVLASGSATRAALLRQAGIDFQIRPAPIDEVALRQSLAAEGISPRDQSDALAEMKAQRVSMKHPDALVIGSDQILALGAQVFGKSDTREAARDTLTQLRGQRHSLFSAAVIYEAGQPIWRHVSEVKLQMRAISDAYLDAYLDRNWPEVAGSVGGYHIEAEGIRLFSTISGDYFAILGMPLLPLLAFLTTKGVIDG